MSAPRTHSPVPKTPIDEKDPGLNPFRAGPVVSLDTALRAVQEALAEGRRREINIAVSIVDPALQLVAFAKSDGAPPDAELLSRRKATAATTMNKPSSDISDDLVRKLVQAIDGVFTNLGGGLPIRFDGQLVGGIGVTGGGPQGGQAAQVAIGQHVLRAIGADSV